MDLKNGYILVVETKNDENRTIPINGVLNMALNSVKYRGLSCFVCEENDKPVTEFENDFHIAIRRAWIHRFTFHDLRHSFGSRLVESGVDLITIQN